MTVLSTTTLAKSNWLALAAKKYETNLDIDP